MTATIPDSDVLQHLDWDHEPGCELPRCVADRPPVTHRVVSLMCPCPPVLVCTPCAEHLAAQHAVLFRLPICKRCRAVKPPSTLGELYRIEPLP